MEQGGKPMITVDASVHVNALNPAGAGSPERLRS